MSLFAVALSGAVVAALGFPTPEKFQPLIAACEGQEVLTNCTAGFHGFCQTDGDGSRFCGQPADQHGFWDKMKAFKESLAFGRPWHKQHGFDRSGGDEHRGGGGGSPGHDELRHGHHEHDQNRTGTTEFPHQEGHPAWSRAAGMAGGPWGFHFPPTDGHQRYGLHHGQESKHHEEHREHHGRHGCPRHLGDCGSRRDGEACSVAREGRCVPTGKCPIFRGQVVCKAYDSHPPEFITKPCEGKQEGEGCKLVFAPGKCEKRNYEERMVCKAMPVGRPEAVTEGSEDFLV